MIFTAEDYIKMHAAVFREGYPGYRPGVRELPNGDGKVDTGKRYAHIALKHDPPPFLLAYLARAHFEACRAAEAMGVPAQYYPRVADGTLRVLEYPPGAGSAEHTDFDLFTILCHRDRPADLELMPSGLANDEALYGAARRINPHLHIGELGALVGLGPATPHRVHTRRYWQRSIVYFAMPDHAAQLPEHEPRTVGEWLRERMARSREYT